MTSDYVAALAALGFILAFFLMLVWLVLREDRAELDLASRRERGRRLPAGDGPSPAPASAPEERVRGGRLVSVGVPLLSVVIAGVSGYVARPTSGPDCVAYSREIRALTAAYPAKQLQAAVDGDLKFGDYEKACGKASVIVRDLGRPTP